MIFFENEPREKNLTTPTTLPHYHNFCLIFSPYPTTKPIQLANFHNFCLIFIKLGMEVPVGGICIKWANFQTTPATLPAYPKTTLIANCSNFGPILMKFGREVWIMITKSKIKFGVPGAMFRPLYRPIQQLWTSLNFDAELYRWIFMLNFNHFSF